MKAIIVKIVYRKMKSIKKIFYKKVIAPNFNKEEIERVVEMANKGNPNADIMLIQQNQLVLVDRLNEILRYWKNEN